MEAMVSPDRYRVERILLQRSPARPPRELLRVKLGTYRIRDCSSVAEVAAVVGLGDPGGGAAGHGIDATDSPGR